MPDEELAAVERALAELGEQPLPPGVATRLDARLAAELTVVAARGAQGAARPAAARRVRCSAGARPSPRRSCSPSARAAGSSPQGRRSASALRDTAATAAADSAAPAAGTTATASQVDGRAGQRRREEVRAG